MNKKLIVLPLILAVVLSAVGLAVAHWTDMVTINGTASMGTCTLAFSRHTPISDPVPIPTDFYWDGSAVQLGQPKGKDVADTEAHYEDEIIDTKSPCVDNWGWRKMVITITKAYPEYYPHITYVIHNIGGLPVDVTFNVYDPTAVLTWHDIPRGAGDTWWYNGYFTNSTGNIVMYIISSNLENPPFQLDPCHSDKGEIDIYFPETAEMCHTYSFVVEVIGTQYN
jgi:hypothetical protein